MVIGIGPTRPNIKEIEITVRVRRRGMSVLRRLVNYNNSGILQNLVRFRSTTPGNIRISLLLNQRKGNNGLPLISLFK
jgi:hypothetical protein